MSHAVPFDPTPKRPADSLAADVPVRSAGLLREMWHLPVLESTWPELPGEPLPEPSGSWSPRSP